MVHAAGGPPLLPPLGPAPALVPGPGPATAYGAGPAQVGQFLLPLEPAPVIMLGPASALRDVYIKLMYRMDIRRTAVRDACDKLNEMAYHRHRSRQGLI